MDKSKQYIEMCADAFEIQYERTPANVNLKRGIVFQPGDYYLEYSRTIVTVLGEDVTPPYPAGDPMWLPRQDQLQKIIKDKLLIGIPGLINGFDMFVTEVGNMFPTVFNTMEQLWLAYAMKTIANKTWSGKQWMK